MLYRVREGGEGKQRLLASAQAVKEVLHCSDGSDSRYTKVLAGKKGLPCPARGSTSLEALARNVWPQCWDAVVHDDSLSASRFRE